MLAAAIVFTAVLVVVALKARPALPIAKRFVGPTLGPLHGMRPEDGTTLFWVDFLAFGKTSLPVGVRPSRPTIPMGVPLRISGWAVDARAKSGAGDVFAQIDNGARVLMTYGTARPDVARHFQAPAYGKAGFRGTIPTNGLMLGIHTIYLDIVSASKNDYYHIDTKQRFIAASK